MRMFLLALTALLVDVPAGILCAQPASARDKTVVLTPLQRALASGLQPGADLSEELEKLEDFQIRWRRDAKAICDALARFTNERLEKEGWPSQIYPLTGLFQDVESVESPAFRVLYAEGIPQLVRIFDAS